MKLRYDLSATEGADSGALRATRDVAGLSGQRSRPDIETAGERVELLEAVVENFPGGISLFDKDMRMVFCNERLKEMLEYPKSLFEDGFPTLENLFYFNALRGEYGPGNPEEQVARRLGLLRARCSHVYERQRPNGRIVEVRGVPLDGGGFVTTYFDVTEQRQNQALIAHMAHHDGLTNLPNRALLIDRLNTAIAMANRGGLVAIHYLDLDGFKKINDSLGHKAGDELLVSVAQRLQKSVRETDTVARLGGDEFAIVQTTVKSSSDAILLAKRVIDSIGCSHTLGAQASSIGVSIGIALAPLDGVTTDDILIKADAAMYQSKAAGSGRFTFFEKT